MQTSPSWYFYDISSAGLSSVALFLVAILILSDRRLHAHPNKLIAYICLCDSYTFMQFVIRYLLCGYGLSEYANWLYAITV